ncbi:hypothetical protein GQR58_002179 [Nymphon striatum]|nr:hypothetical protein GQR58_002179 [Nymphon striatum]
MKILLTALALTLASQTASAQDRDGNDTAGQWRHTHAESYGLWESICDEVEVDEVPMERCYIRYVDGFSPRPNFGALFSFVNATSEGVTLDFGIERGTRFKPSGFRLERDGQTIWENESILCLRLQDCFYDPEQARPIIELMASADVFIFDFTDRHDQEQTLVWDMTAFGDALEDQATQVSLREYIQ